MVITTANTGDLLCLYQTGKRIRILEVVEDMITYQEESGERYATYAHQADAFVDSDSTRRSIFDYNSNVGQALNAAEINALKKLFSAPAAERAEADHVLSVIREQKTAFEQRINQEKGRETPSPALAKAFLDQLYEKGTGSHDTFFGRKVENVSSYSGSFSIDGQHCDYHTALQRLSAPKAQVKEQKAGLDAQIASAKSRQGRGTGNRPVLTAEKHGREDGR